MQKEKGQIHIVLVILLVIVIVWFYFFPGAFTRDGGTEEAPRGSSYIPQEEESTISPVAEEEKEEEEAIETPLDKTPPQRSNPQPIGGLPSSTRKVSMSLETNEKATCRYETDSGFFYESMQHTFSETGGTFHSTQITTLSEGMGYVYYVRCMDEAGNKNTNDFIITFYVKNPADFTPPERLHPYPAGDVFPAGTSVTISVSTNEPANCRYALQQGVVYNSMRNNFSRDDYQTFHTVKLKSLTAGSYEYFVRCKDLKGNVNTGDVMIYFTVSP